MKKLALILFTSLGFFVLGGNNMYEITITNLTKNQIFAPPVVITHSRDFHLFQLGQPASEPLYTMAEDGDPSMIANEAMADENVLSVATGDGPVMPGQSVTFEVEAQYLRSYLTVAGMLVDTNDGFFALDGESLRIAYFKGVTSGSQTFMAWVYDAGSELNTESCEHIPGPPCGSGGVRVTEGAEGYVYPHPGIHGMGDLSIKDYGWSGPAAMITVTPQP